MKNEYTFRYAVEEDILVIQQPGKIEHSLDIGNFIVDFDEEDRVRGIEILDISSVLGNLGIKNAKEILRSIDSASLKVESYFSDLMVYYFINSRHGKVSSTITVSREMLTPAEA